MSTRKVTTKKEFKQAIKDNVDTIVISKELEKELKALLKIMRMPQKKRNAMITFLGVSGVTLVGSVAMAPVTMGLSGIVSSGAVVSFAAASGTSVSLVVAIILLCVAIGVPTVISCLRAYEVENDEFEFEFMGIQFRRKVKYRSK